MDTTPRSTFALSLLPRPSSSPLPLSSSSSSSSTSFVAASSSSEAHADARSALDPPLPPPPTALSAPSSHPPTHLFDQHPEATTDNVVDPSISTSTGSTSALQLLNISGTQLDDTLRSSSTPAPPQAITTSDSEDRIQSSRPPKRVRLSLEEDSLPSSPSSPLSVDPQSAISPDSQREWGVAAIGDNRRSQSLNIQPLFPSQHRILECREHTGAHQPRHRIIRMEVAAASAMDTAMAPAAWTSKQDRVATVIAIIDMAAPGSATAKIPTARRRHHCHRPRRPTMQAFAHSMRAAASIEESLCA